MNEKLKNAVATVAVMVLLAPAAFAQTAGSPKDSIAKAESEILSLVAIAGAAFIAVALAGVGWTVGAKFIKRIGGKA